MESSLAITHSELKAKVGEFLGYGRGADFGEPAWSDRQAAVIVGCVESGLRQFYFPPPIEGQETAYDWSFMHPLLSVRLASGASTILMPNDFGGLEGPITLLSTSSQVSWPVQLTNPALIRERFSELPDATGRPLMAALEPIKGTTMEKGQRWKMDVFPLADQDYTLQAEYYLAPNALSTTQPYHLGGVAHSETVLESCLAIAEQRFDDSSSVHTMKFNQRLMASINMDRKSKPQNLGYNRDLSDRRDRYGNRSRNHYWDAVITVNGVQY